jgi:hypothetical protein
VSLRGGRLETALFPRILPCPDYGHSHHAGRETGKLADKSKESPVSPVQLLTLSKWTDFESGLSLVKFIDWTIHCLTQKSLSAAGGPRGITGVPRWV